MSAAHNLKPSIQIELYGIDAQRWAIDGVRAQVAQPHPNPVRESVVGEEVVTGCVRADKVKIRVSIGIEHRIALQITIADDTAPGAGREHRRIAEADLRLIALGARRDVKAEARRNARRVVSEVPDRIRSDPQGVAPDPQFVGRVQIRQTILRRQREQIYEGIAAVADVLVGIALAQEHRSSVVVDGTVGRIQPTGDVEIIVKGAAETQPLGLADTQIQTQLRSRQPLILRRQRDFLQGMGACSKEYMRLPSAAVAESKATRDGDTLERQVLVKNEVRRSPVGVQEPAADD